MEKLIIIKTLAQLQQLTEYIKDKDFLTFDTETDGVDKDSRIIGFSVCAEVETGYYVILSSWDVEQKKLINLPTMEGAKAFLEQLKSHPLVMHNGVFDCSMVENNFQVQLMPSLHTDTMILAHLIDENRRVGLKELAVSIYGQSSTVEQAAMKASVINNGGTMTKTCFELYKGDADLIAEYGAKDAILTLKLFYHLVPELYSQGLMEFFYDEESMPLLKGPTYSLNTTGLKVDQTQLQKLKATLVADIEEARTFIYNEINYLIKEEYPGTSKAKTFNIGSNQQLAWLLFHNLQCSFNTLTDQGKELCKCLNIPIPYTVAAKKQFVQTCIQNRDRVYVESCLNEKTGKKSLPKKVGDPWKYMACDKNTLQLFAKRFKWVQKTLEMSKNKKLLNTYVEGIQERLQYGVIHPSFLQHGTTSGRYSSKQPNFQNLPREDKRVKACIVSRPGKLFVGADYSQLEPRVFASFSKDERLLKCFKDGDDFYSVIGMEVFNKTGLSLKKDDENSFAKKHPDLRNISKAVALAATYGTTAPRMAPAIGKSIEDTQDVINSYFESYPSVKNLMMESHAQAKKHGFVTNLFGRPRRMPEAMDIEKLYGKKTPHDKLPYSARNTLNLAVNHRIQSTGASIINRAAIAFHNRMKQLGLNALIVLNVHDEIVVECDKGDREVVVTELRNAMENTTVLPGVSLIADPKIASNLSDLK